MSIYNSTPKQIFENVRNRRLTDSFLKKVLMWGLALGLLIASISLSHAATYKVSVLGTNEYEIHSKFASVIESSMTKARVAKVIDSMNAQELSDLYSAYYRATGGNIYPLDGMIKSYASLTGKMRWSMAKQGQLIGKSAGYSGKYGMRTVRTLPIIDFTPYEIYLEFRTAPLGSLMRTAALYETANFIAMRAAIAYGVGYATGTVIYNIMDRYSPSLTDAIGGTIQAAMDNITNATSIFTQGRATADLGNRFGMGGYSSWSSSGSIGGFGNGLGDFNSLAAGSYAFNTGYIGGSLGGSWIGSFQEFMENKAN